MQPRPAIRGEEIRGGTILECRGLDCRGSEDSSFCLLSEDSSWTRACSGNATANFSTGIGCEISRFDVSRGDALAEILRRGSCPHRPACYGQGGKVFRK